LPIRNDGQLTFTNGEWMLISYFQRFKEKYLQNRGQRLLTQGQNKKAYTCFEKALILNNNYINQFNMGLVLIAMNKHSQALGYLEKTLEQFPDNEVILTTIGESYTVLRQWDKAIECYQKLHENHSDFPLYKKHYERLLDAEKREQYVNSRELFFKGLELQEQKLLNEAIESFQQALSFDEDNAMINNTIGIAMSMANKSKKEIEPYFEMAVKLSPQNEGFKRNLASVKARKK